LSDLPAPATVRGAINAHVGGRLRALRIAQGKTQAELGAALGLTNQQIQKYEKGVNSISLERIWLAACHLGVDVDDLLEGIAAAAGTAAPPDHAAETAEHPQLRLEVTEALRRTRSASVLSSVLQLLRAVDADHADPGAGAATAEAARPAE
jgi:transcriptional regulator with XRE-family HTH domain